MSIKETRYLSLKVSEIADEDDFLPKGKFTVVIDYPLSVKRTFTVQGPLSVAKLSVKLAEEYRKIYKQPEKYGIWYPYIQDLVIERMRLDTVKKVVTLDVGS